MNPTEAKYPNVRRKGGYKDPRYRKSKANTARLRKLMADRAMTHEHVAAVLGVQRRTVRHWLYVSDVPAWAIESLEG